MIDSNKFYIALKSYNYDYADKYLRFHISYCQNELELTKRPESTKQPEIVKYEFQKTSMYVQIF